MSSESGPSAKRQRRLERRDAARESQQEVAREEERPVEAAAASSPSTSAQPEATEAKPAASAESERAAARSDEQGSGSKGQGSSVRWPWIPLMDASGRQYYYNALTSKTAWSMAEGETTEAAAPPPTAFTAASAQAAWQRYWEQWQKAQATESLSRVVPGLTQPAPQEETAATTPAGGGPPMPMKTGGPSVAAAMSVYIEHYQTPNAKQLGRPSRQQVRPPENESLGYTQGSEEYNIWYGKYLTDRFENPGLFGRREEREKATTRCNPFTDSGWTRCDLEAQLDRPVICIYYARGCCYLGSNCRYYHRLPTAEDDEKLDMLHDIFGRERYASHRDDMDGVGTFSEDCRTLFVGDLKVNRVYPNAEEKSEELIRQQFGLWGPIEDIKVVRNKNIAFVRFKYRVHAEFAKVAMAEQRLLLDRPDDQLCVRWAHAGRGSEDKPDEQQAREWDQANKAMMKRLSSLGYTQDDLECLIRWEIQQASKDRPGLPAPGTALPAAAGEESAVTAKYPNTNQRFESARLPQPLAEQQPPAEEEETDALTRPDSEASKGLYKMQAVLSRIESAQKQDPFSVDI